MVMQFSTGQTLTQRLQPTHSSSITSKCRTPSTMLGDRLVRGVLAGDVAAAAFDAGILVDVRLGDVVEVEILPVGDVGRGAADDVVERGMALLVHPVLEAGDHLLDDLEAVGHGGGADLHVAGAERHELGGVAPGGDAADAGDRQAARLRVAGDLGHHVQAIGFTAGPQ